MRIVAGEFKGRSIDSPSGSTTRPTTDRVRESMFSSLMSRCGDFDELAVLDAFAGSGALGIEALSRGASRALFIERDAAARKVLNANLTKMGLRSPRAAVDSSDTFKVSTRRLIGAPFSIVLLDPPYAIEPEQVATFLGELAASGNLAEGAAVAYEHDAHNKEKVEAAFAATDCFEHDGWKRYGKIGVIYLAYNEKQQ